MIGVAARGAAARVTLFVLLGAFARTVLPEPFGTAIFAAVLLVIWIRERPTQIGKTWPLALSLLIGLISGAVLVLLVHSGFPVPIVRPEWFYGWAFAAATVAVLEELAIRGVLQPLWSAEVGALAAVVLGALVFAVIHLPRYGLAALPLDFAVGLVLGGLRIASGRVLPAAVAHVVADLGAYL
jgi:membrane protease YdiL (CAAX protease family)